jgi:hypothetical protein
MACGRCILAGDEDQNNRVGPPFDKLRVNGILFNIPSK